jgi:hypothetical protein
MNWSKMSPEELESHPVLSISDEADIAGALVCAPAAAI